MSGLRRTRASRVRRGRDPEVAVEPAKASRPVGSRSKKPSKGGEKGPKRAASAAAARSSSRGARSTGAERRASARGPTDELAPPIAVRWLGARAFLAPAEIRRTARAALREGGRPSLRLSIAVVTDRELTRLHGEWLGDPTPTDVLSFDLSDDLSEAGEIVASHTCARRTARERGVAAGRELALYVVHGVLHLCGHDDHAQRDRAAMRAAERRVLDALGWPDDLAPHDAREHVRRAATSARSRRAS